MQGDFSRLTFDPNKHYRSVRMQQGRVQLDADWNEQIDIINYYNETCLKDLLGPAGAPAASAGFKISIPDQQTSEDTGSGASVTRHDHQGIAAPDFHISSGRYYVDGILCENERDRVFSEQSAFQHGSHLSQLKEFVVAYLDVWKRHVTSFEDPALREIALGGIDTTTREQVVWQVKLLPPGGQQLNAASSQTMYEHILALPEWRKLVGRTEHRGFMAARSSQSIVLENHLYRVEIHSVQDNTVTFKWSRENGSVIFALESISEGEKKNNTLQYIVTLSEQVRDQTLLRKGDWVEFVDPDIEAEGHTLPLYQVVDLPGFGRREVLLAGRPSPRLAKLVKQSGTSLLLRRWDYDVNRPSPAEGTTVLREDTLLDLERGIQVRFVPGGKYNVGDYWLIPSRTLVGIEWPSDEHGPHSLPPQGIDHHYCPLALLHFSGGKWQVTNDLRQLFSALPAVTTSMENGRIGGNLVEKYEAGEELAIGDLVSLVPMTKNSVSRANLENARLLLGVVTKKEDDDSKEQCAVTIYGRARCKVIGPVEWGDLLTVSHKDGCARVLRSEHIASHYGTILGKALGAYLPDDRDDVNLVDVMVTLH